MEKELKDIDLDVMNLINKIPKNENHSVAYTRCNYKNSKAFFYASSEPDCIIDLIENFIGVNQEEGFEHYSKRAILNLAINILKKDDEYDIDEFIGHLKRDVVIPTVLR